MGRELEGAISKPGTVKKLDELVTDERIKEAIQKYSMGGEIWWSREYVNAQQRSIDPATQQAVITNLPVMQIFLGMPGYLIGPEHYVWWVINLDANPTAEKLDNNIRETLDKMRARKAQQTNGLGRI